MLRLSVFAAAAAALAWTAAVPAQGASAQLGQALAAPKVASPVSEAQFRRHGRRHGHWRGHWHRRDRGAWLALGLGSAVVGGMLAARNTPGYVYADSAWDRCASEFRSFRADGTYTTYDGRQVVCPYLR